MEVVKLKKFVLKLVHMGKATSISIDDHKTVNRVDKSNPYTLWSYLNVFDNS